MTIANPLVGTVLAVIGFNEPLPRTPAGLAGLAIGAALVCVGVYVLAHSPLLAEPLPDPAEVSEQQDRTARPPGRQPGPAVRGRGRTAAPPG
jgi:hypothetical protein